MRHGDICVIRQSNAIDVILRLENQSSYKEWTGCFCYIDVKVYKPTKTISHGMAKTKHIDITWEQLEAIKQLLINTSESE